jgi:hypothetical protein
LCDAQTPVAGSTPFAGASSPSKHRCVRSSDGRTLLGGAVTANVYHTDAHRIRDQHRIVTLVIPTLAGRRRTRKTTREEQRGHNNNNREMREMRER